MRLWVIAEVHSSHQNLQSKIIAAGSCDDERGQAVAALQGRAAGCAAGGCAPLQFSLRSITVQQPHSYSVCTNGRHGHREPLSEVTLVLRHGWDITYSTVTVVRITNLIKQFQGALVGLVPPLGLFFTSFARQTILELYLFIELF